MFYYVSIFSVMQIEVLLSASFDMFNTLGFVRKHGKNGKIHNCTRWCSLHTLTDNEWAWQESCCDIAIKRNGKGTKYGHMLCGIGGSDHGTKNKQTQFFFNHAFPVQRTGYVAYLHHVQTHSAVIQFLYVYV